MGDKTEREPFFSIIVPTYNRRERLAACLRSLADLNYPTERYEVLVVDDGSRTPPASVVREFEPFMHIRMIARPHAGPAAARNAGAAEAEGKYLAFTDDDCTPRKDWLLAIAAAFAEAPDALIGGPAVNILAENIYSAASHLLIDYLHSYYNLVDREVRFLTSNNMAVAADRFREIGGFDPRFPIAAAEDRELCDRWRFHSLRLVYLREAVVHHTHELSLRSFWRQHFNYGCGAFHFHRVRRNRGDSVLDVETPAFYLNLLKHPFSRVERRKVIPILALMCISQLANALGFYRTAMLQMNQ